MRYTGLFCGVVMLLSLPAIGAAETSAPAREFQLSAQPLDSALTAFSQASGLQMLYDSDLVSGRRSKAVEGRFTPADALHRLLEDTGLRAHFTQKGSIVIMPARTPDMVLDALTVTGPQIIGMPDNRPYLPYVDKVQQDIIKSLQADESLGDNYDIGLKLWIGRDGRVERVSVLYMSGPEEMAALFSEAVKGILISAPPPETMPQPVRVEFRLRR